MTKKINRVQYELNPCKSRLNDKEIKTIIRGADDVVYEGGRTLLAKLLKGSKDKKIIEYGLDKNPSYGAFKPESIEEIISMIDRMIKDHYLRIEYDYRLPLLAYEEEGLKIAREIISDEYFQKVRDSVETGNFRLAETFKDKSREMIFMLLEKIRDKGSEKFMPFLEHWKNHDYKKVQARINNVIFDLKKFKI